MIESFDTFNLSPIPYLIIIGKHHLIMKHVFYFRYWTIMRSNGSKQFNSQHLYPECGSNCTALSDSPENTYRLYTDTIRKQINPVPPYLTARCASSLVYLSKDFLHDLPSLSDKENHARQVEYKYKSSISVAYLHYPHRAILSISWCQIRSLKHSELIAVVKNESICKIHRRNCHCRVYPFYRIKLRRD